jgi:hypothetical protein
MTDLSERIRRLFDAIPPVSLDEAIGWETHSVGRTRARRRASRKQLVVLGGCVILLGAIVTFATTRSPVGRVAVAGNTSSATTGPHPIGVDLEVEIKLSQTSVTGGISITGVAVLTNTTEIDLVLDVCSEQAILLVGLSNDRLHFHPIHPSQGCLGASVHLTPGRNSIPISVSTQYGSCTNDVQAVTLQEPACLAGGALPSLPSGNYATDIVSLGLPQGSRLPAPTPVTILP